MDSLTKILTAILFLSLLSLGACGLKLPPVPPDPPTALDDDSDIRKNGVNIVDDSAKRLFKLYGGKPKGEQSSELVEPVPEEIDEVPPEYRYLYEPESDDQKKKKSNKDKNEKSKSE